MYYFYQHLIFVNWNSLKSHIVLSKVYSKLFILRIHGDRWFVLFFIFFLLWNFLLKFLPRKKIQQRTRSVLNCGLYQTWRWRASACVLPSLDKAAGEWREGGKSAEPSSSGCLAALLSPLLCALVLVLGQREGVSQEMPVPSRQMSTAPAVVDLRGLTSFPCPRW